MGTKERNFTKKSYTGVGINLLVELLTPDRQESMFHVFSRYDQAVNSLERDRPLYSMFLNPVQQPALGLRFPSAEAPQTSYTHCPSFILCIFTSPSNANSGSSGESCPSPEQVLTETFVHHRGIYSCCTLQEIKREQTYDSASLLCRQWFASHSLQSRMPPTKT